MAAPQLSPGVVVREVDLTVGGIDQVVDNVGAIAAPFALGPVNEATLITTEQELIDTFGTPISTDRQYEHWLSATEYLTYGGVLQVVRVSGSNLVNANAGVGIAATSSLLIENKDDYELNHLTDQSFTYAARNPGRWANNMKVCTIDAQADQTIGIAATNPGGIGVTVGYGVTVALTNLVLPGAGTTSLFNGYLKGIVTGIFTDAVNENSSFDVKITSRVSAAATELNTTLTSVLSPADGSAVGLGTTVVGFTTFFVDATTGVNTNDTVLITNNGEFSLASVGATSIVLSTGIAATVTPGTAVTFRRVVSTGGTETSIEYLENFRGGCIKANDVITFSNSVDGNGNPVPAATVTANTALDWYEQQTLQLSGSTLFWKNVAPRPKTSKFASDRSSKNDTIHVVVVDDQGDVTGIPGNILEQHLNLSKATDTIGDGTFPTRTYYKDYILENSNYIFVGGRNPSASADGYFGTRPSASGFSTEFTANTVGAGLWGVETRGVNFSGLGNNSYSLTGGEDYGANGGMEASLGDIKVGYELFKDEEGLEVDYLIMGAGGLTKEESQAKANLLIAIAEERKDCIAVISPHRGDVVNISNSTTQTNNVLEFYAPITSSSYAIFDSGYKYIFDRFNNQFVYVPCNADIAGICVRTELNIAPWVSPAGQIKGSLNNAIKLAYNPTKAQRDLLYGNRINPVINQRGVGIILFGDKTGLSYSSAFDRINVRKLFLNIEQSIEGTANDQLFEFNDDDTRDNFVETVEPFLRDIQANGGIVAFQVICDDSNNTPEVIENNQFVADIFVQPATSINFITLNFVATRQGSSISEEVTGR